MINNIEGKTIGVFQILSDSGKRESGGNVMWNIKCMVCGGNKALSLNSIKRYQSCGCKTADIQSAALRKSLNRGGFGEIYASHWNVVKKNAKQRKLPFEITVKYAWELFLKQNRKCALTGEPLVFSTRCWSRDATASLDRIDSSMGYVENNVQWVHKQINMMKQQYPTELFFQWCKKVVEYNNL